MADAINDGMKKVIKGMVVACQTAQFVSLIPKPKDFVVRVVSDVVYMSAQVQKLSDEINKLLDSYAEIPSQYIMTQVNSITGSLSSITNRLDLYTQSTLNITGNTVNDISDLASSISKTSETLANTIESFGNTVAHTDTSILGRDDVSKKINSAADVILEWNGDGFDGVTDDVISPMNDAINSISDAKNTVSGISNDITSTLSDSSEWVESILNYIKESMNTLSNKLDNGFSEYTGLGYISTNSSYVADALDESGNNSASAQMVKSVSESLATVLKNFSLSKIIAAFGGVITQSVIVKTGLDQLPPIDFESMLGNIRSDMIETNVERMQEINTMIEDIDDDLSAEKERKDDEKEYGDDEYKKFVSQFNDELKKQRDDIRRSMRCDVDKLTDIQKNAKSVEETRQLKSAIKEVRKFKKKIKNAKKSETLLNKIKTELERLKKEAEYRCNDIKSDWTSMMDTYNNAISEIKEFFQNGGDGDMFIDDCCKVINDDCKSIKELCKNISSQLIYSTIKVAMPADIGSVVPNPVYKLSDFWMDVKTIVKFIKDLILYVIDIYNNVNKLARIMINGLNNLTDIVNELIELLGLSWFVNLVQDIIDFFGDKIKDVRSLLENMLAPVYYGDTDEYNNTLEALDEYLEGDNSGDMSVLQSSVSSNIYHKISFVTLANGMISKFDESNIEDIIGEIEDKEDDIVAYRSPILADSTGSNDKSVSDIISGDSLDSDIKLIGWRYFHPHIDGLSKRKNKIIKRASKKSHKKRGGINMLNRKNIKKQKAYDVFYWYTYYTEDLEDDSINLMAEDNSVEIHSSVSTQNGTIVELTDGRRVFVNDTNVKSGDYVNVEGVKYRVK